MAYDIQISLPHGWQSEREDYTDESGAEISHFEAYLPSKEGKSDDGMIDIYVGEMPEDTTAEDQALSNYADIVGFEDDDPEDFNPITRIKFNGKSAYVFDALCEDESPMLFLSQEIKKGVLAIICAASRTNDSLQELMVMIEKNLRIK